MPIDSVIVEISNAMLVDKMFRHFSSKHSTPKHIPPSDSPKIIQLLPGPAWLRRHRQHP